MDGSILQLILKHFQQMVDIVSTTVNLLLIMMMTVDAAAVVGVNASTGDPLFSNRLTMVMLMIMMSMMMIMSVCELL